MGGKLPRYQFFWEALRYHRSSQAGLFGEFGILWVLLESICACQMVWLLGRRWPILERRGNRAVAVASGCGCCPTGGLSAAGLHGTGSKMPVKR